MDVVSSVPAGYKLAQSEASNTAEPVRRTRCWR